MPRPWRPTATLKVSALVHGAALLGPWFVPGSWPYAAGALLLNHACLATAGLLPRSTLLGPNLVRLPATDRNAQAIALTIDDGPDPEVTPRVLDLLDAAGVRASFFCIGHRARRHPVLCREIVDRGHRVENHGDGHSKVFSLFGPGRMKRDIQAAQSCLEDITGQRPQFFRATAGLRNPFLEPVLAELDLTLAAWTRRAYDTRCGDPALVHDRLVRGLAARDILLLHDGHAALTADQQPVILAVLPRLLRTLADRHLASVTLADACS